MCNRLIERRRIELLGIPLEERPGLVLGPRRFTHRIAAAATTSTTPPEHAPTFVSDLQSVTAEGLRPGFTEPSWNDVT
jgi:hypothetical protein